MKERRLYWRKKGSSLVLEGRTTQNKPILLWTLPNANAFYNDILVNASFLSQEKLTKIKEKFERLGFRDTNISKEHQDVRTTEINTSFENDALEDSDA